MAEGVKKTRVVHAPYLERLVEALATINEEAVSEFADRLLEISNSGGRVWVIGNGGSAATASHMATDLGVGAHRSGVAIPIVSLADNTSVVTATGNDVSFEAVFSDQIQLLGREGDLLIAISASGNSPNLIAAAKTAERLGMELIALTGFDGGRLAKIADMSVHVRTLIGDYGVAEDAHLAINHMVKENLQIAALSKHKNLDSNE